MRNLSIVLAVAVLFPVMGCGVPAADEPAESFGLDFSWPRPETAHGTIVFIVDGLNATIFEEMLEAGELPNLRQYFVDRGIYVRRATSNIPSVTMANLTSLTTGLMPGHHHVTGVNWFDRHTYIWREYNTIAQKNTLDDDYVARTIYEHFPREMTVSIFFQPHRGTTKFFENWTSAGPPYFFGWYEFVDRLSLYRLGEMMELARQRKQFPVLVCVYMLATDFRAYENGVSSEDYRNALRHTDDQLGRVIADIRSAGLLDRLNLAVISDHSLGDVEHHQPLYDWLKKHLGWKIAYNSVWEKQPLDERQDHFEEYPVALYGSGDRYMALCLRKPIRDESGKCTGYEPWPTRPSPEDLRNYPVEPSSQARETFSALGEADSADLTCLLAKIPSVEAIAWAEGPNRVRIRCATEGREGVLEFRQPGGPRGAISAVVVEGDDPFGYVSGATGEMVSRSGAEAGEYMPREWLAASAQTDYPALPTQIVAYFRSRRAGDIALFAQPGWDFRHEHQAGHGGLRGFDDMFVPMLLVGPDVPRARLENARNIDIVPTLLELLGRPVPADLDGQSLLKSLAEEN